MNREELQKIIGDLLRDLRKELPMSQEKFAHECDLDRTYISLIERGKRQISVHTMLKVADGLNIPAAEFIAKLEERMKAAGLTIKEEE